MTYAISEILRYRQHQLTDAAHDEKICAQCLHMQRDPITGKKSVMFSRFNRDQSLDKVDLANLRTRLRQIGAR